MTAATQAEHPPGGLSVRGIAVDAVVVNEYGEITAVEVGEHEVTACGATRKVSR
jgi:hypothetical protein